MAQGDLEAWGVRITQYADGVRYVLPGRRLGPWRFLGLIPLLLGLVFVSVPAGIVSQAIDADDPIFSVFIGVFAGVFIVVGLMPIAAGLAIFAGRSRLEIRGDRVVVSEGIGPIRKRWKRDLGDLTGVVVGVPEGGMKRKLRRIEGINADSLRLTKVPGLPEPRSVVTFMFSKQEPLAAALGYPHELAVALAEHAAGFIRADDRVTLFGEGGEPIRVLAADRDAVTSMNEFDAGDSGDASDGRSTWGGLDRDHIPDQPAKSRCVLDVRDDGLTLTVPPVGVIKGSKGLFVFSLIWLAFIGVFIGFVIGLGELPSLSGNDFFGSMLMLLMGLLFVGIGVAMLVFSINAGRRRAILDVVGSTLLISRQSIFGLKQDEIPADNIKRIRVGPSGAEVNNQPIMELQVHRNKGGKLGMLSQLDDEDLEWIAAVMRNALGVAG